MEGSYTRGLLYSDQGHQIIFLICKLTNSTHVKTRNFQKFLSDDGNESLQYNPPLPPSLDST